MRWIAWLPASRAGDGTDAVKLNSMTLSQPRRWTYEDYLALPEDGRRYEVIDGELLMSPSPRTVHQIVSRRLQFFLYQLEQRGLGAVFNAPMDLLMPGCSPVQPDLIFLLPEQFGMVKTNFIEGIPQMLVEVLSPSNASHDRVRKLNRYAASGVAEYVMVDPEERTLEHLRLDRGAYRLEAALAEEDRWSYGGFTLDLKDLFAPLGIPTA